MTFKARVTVNLFFLLLAAWNVIAFYCEFCLPTASQTFIWGISTGVLFICALDGFKGTTVS